MANQEPSPQSDKEAFEAIAAAEVLIGMSMGRCVGCPMAIPKAEALVVCRTTDLKIEGTIQRIQESLDNYQGPPSDSELELKASLGRMELLRSESDADRISGELQAWNTKCATGWTPGAELTVPPNHPINCGLNEERRVLGSRTTSLLRKLGRILFD